MNSEENEIASSLFDFGREDEVKEDREVLEGEGTTRKFKVGSGKKIWRVTEFNAALKRLLEGEFGEITVEGEVTNFSRSQAGHYYFSLCEQNSQLACTLFSGNARRTKVELLKNGVTIRATGEVTTYEGRSQYQLDVRTFELAGRGELLARFEEIKRRLEAEGLFSSERKRSLPAYPRCIGVVTSPQAAALQDFLKVLWARNPHITVILSPCRVQGNGASVEIAQAIELLTILPSGNTYPEVIVVTRGGGSFEDLWEFNEEIVARAIAASPVPVISAIGHEVDFTIADFVADVRAATPSNAAEIVTQRAVEMRENLGNILRALNLRIRERYTQLKQRTSLVFSRPLIRYPDRIIIPYRQRLDYVVEKLFALKESYLRRLEERLIKSIKLLRAYHPSRWAEERKKRLQEIDRRIQMCGRTVIDSYRNRLESRMKLLQALSPQKSLERGYTLTFGEDDRLICSASEAVNYEVIYTRFADGKICSKIIPKKED
ncbi:MAG: exodeoxyribonuclease VII large subunit [Chthoniobacterales bacterium]|nr:exodeoxyribonuclease VII large subunit [Chthoniobacterales bacterium]